MNLKGNQSREAWIDYAKAVGMLLIVWGHFFPPHVSKYIYSINVPIFFSISGYLYKDLPFNKLIIKNIRSLIVPYLIFAFLNISIYLGLGSISIGDLWISILGILLGCHSIDGIPCAGALWFVYDLFIIKMLYHFASKNSITQVISALFSLGLAIYINTLAWPTTVSPLLSVPIAYCFFVFGRIIREYDLPSFRNNWKSVLLMVILFVVYFACARRNSNAYLYVGQLGKSVFLFIPASIIGLVLFYSTVIILKPKNNFFAIATSCGTIVTLSIHQWLINISRHIISSASPVYPLTSFIASLLIMVVCFVMICLINKFIPLLLGGRRFA